MIKKKQKNKTLNIQNSKCKTLYDIKQLRRRRLNW